MTVTGRKRLIIDIVVGLCILLFLINGSFHIVTRIILETNIDTIKELANHDKKVLLNTLDDYWCFFNFIPLSIDNSVETSNEQIFNTLEAVNSMSPDSKTFICNENNDIYTSDNKILKDDNINNIIKKYNDKFAIYYNDSLFDDLNDSEYLIIGRKFDEFYINNIKFDYVFTIFQIDSLDNEFIIDSFNGEGFSSLIDKNGSYIVNVNRNEGQDVHENFYECLNFNDYKLQKLKYNIDNNSDGVSFNTTINGVKYIVYIVKLDGTDWNFVSQVPSQAFSKLTLKLVIIPVLFWLFVIFILIGVLLNKFKSIKSKEKQDAEYRNSLSSALESANIANKAKTDFLNSMSHDIRTPMNAIIGYTSLAIKHIDDTKLTYNYLNKINDSSEHLLNLINDILDMSRIESGSVTLNLDSCCLDDIITSVYTIVSNGAEDKGINLTVNSNYLEKYVICDKVRLSQILVNILSNAIKYTNKFGKVTFDINENNGVYTFIVEDDGIGMDDEFVKTIFEPFTREKNNQTRLVQGSGLGMSIAKSIVEKMSGSIKCQSKKGVGTKFIVTIPLAKANLNLKNEVEVDNVETSLKGINILLVEDNPLNQEITKTILEDEQANVIIANNGFECLELIKNKNLDIILMDIQMPEMDGYEATRRIRELDDPYFKNVLIVAMSANAFTDDNKKALDVGMNGYITKPIKLDKLVSYLKFVLSSKKS